MNRALPEKPGSGLLPVTLPTRSLILTCGMSGTSGTLHMRGFFLAVTALSALVEAAIRAKEDRFVKMMRTNGTKRRRPSRGRQPRTAASVLSRALKKKRLGVRFQRNKEVEGRLSVRSKSGGVALSPEGCESCGLHALKCSGTGPEC